MLEPLFFTLGLLNNGFLIFIFLIRKQHLASSAKNRLGIFSFSNSSHLRNISGPTGTEGSAIHYLSGNLFSISSNRSSV